jgi:predicted transcriptional regulator
MEILGDMIRLTAEGMGKTHIMFKANLSYAQTANISQS